MIRQQGVSKTVSDGKIVITVPKWPPTGFYFLIIAVNSQYIWQYFASFIWGFKILGSDCANASLSDVTFSGDRGNGLTITVTNSNIKTGDRVSVVLKTIHI